MNKLDAAIRIVDLARTHLPDVLEGVKALIGPKLTEAERSQLEAHISDYENMAAEQRRKAGGG